MEDSLQENIQRMCRNFGLKILDENKVETALSDPNRPTKLGERYAELYDNEWTDAYVILSPRFHDNDKEVVTKLRDILTYIFQYCSKLSRDQEQDLKQAMMVPPSKMDERLPKFVMEQFKENRKANVEEFLKSHLNIFQMEYELSSVFERGIDSFVEESFEISWLMNIQDPPIEIDTKTDRHDAFDRNAYKEYTVSGPTIDYVVWPTARLHRGGPILFKGVAQCIPNPAILTPRQRACMRYVNEARLPFTRIPMTEENGTHRKDKTPKPPVTHQADMRTNQYIYNSTRPDEANTTDCIGIRHNISFQDSTKSNKSPGRHIGQTPIARSTEIFEEKKPRNNNNITVIKIERLC